jgi:fumarate hydratase subunit alpha
LNETTREAYGDAYLRKSVCNPLTRKNAGDNTPAIIHCDIVKGDKLKIVFCAKGGGYEDKWSGNSYTRCLDFWNGIGWASSGSGDSPEIKRLD